MHSYTYRISLLNNIYNLWRNWFCRSYDTVQRKNVVTQDGSFNSFEFHNNRTTSHKKFVVPSWFRNYFKMDEDSNKYWKRQYQLARQGKEHKLPDDRMRMPSNELHQLMAKSFIDELLLSPYNDFETILDLVAQTDI